MTDLLTVAEVAASLKVSEKTVFRKFDGRPGVVDLGTVENVRRKRRPRRVLRIPRAVLERFIMERTV